MKPTNERWTQAAAEAKAVSVPEAMGHSEAFLAFQERLSRVAPVDRPVLLLGERGTGKELAAARLHYLSRRWGGPFVALNCSALAPSLLEAELFGHEPGAFTGATHRRKGRFEAAHEGTLFLDEIGQIPREIQEKILRVVEYGSFERVGSSSAIEVNTRIIAATNADLEALVADGHFKADLLDRLSFEVLFLPPLRVRIDDIEYLANHFATRMAHELGRTEIPQFSEEAMAALTGYSWPGNIRELKNVVERAIYRADNAQIEHIDFTPFRSPYSEPSSNQAPSAREPSIQHESLPDAIQAGQPLPEMVQDLEQRSLKKALVEANFNQRKAARLLGLTYHQFRGLYRKHQGSTPSSGQNNADDASPPS